MLLLKFVLLSFLFFFLFFFFSLNIYLLLFVSTSKLEIWTHWRAKVSSGRRWGHMVSASDDLLKELQWFVGHPIIFITNQPYLLHLRDIKTNRQLMFYADNDKHVSKGDLREPYVRLNIAWKNVEDNKIWVGMMSKRSDDDDDDFTIGNATTTCCLKYYWQRQQLAKGTRSNNLSVKHRSIQATVKW